MTQAGVVLLDRDGVLNELVPDPDSGLGESPLRVEDVALIDGAGEAVRRLRDQGWRVAGVSNQPAAAKRKVSVEELLSINRRVLELLAQAGATFDDFRLCLHHPAASVDALRGPCECRKPAPGLLLAAAETLGADLRRSWMVGDTDSDVLAGQAAGCKTVLVEHRSSVHKRTSGAGATVTAPSLRAAVRMIEET